MEELKAGDIIKERYTLVKFLGNGSFGEVWLAHDLMSGRDVALKIYLTLDPAGVEEFQREYANTIDLSSQYLLTPDYFDIYGRRPYLVMKYCAKGSSSSLVGKISEEELWRFIHDVASGLAILHAQSDPIVHQDIKPDNILIDDTGRFLITDFGISKRLRATMRRQSRRDVSSGAMPYMAPEKFGSGTKLTTATDIWSLGASIYELATGELPFSGFGGAMLKNGAEMPALPLRFSEALNKIMQSCLNPDASCRPTAAQLSEWAKTKKVPDSQDTTQITDDSTSQGTDVNVNEPVNPKINKSRRRSVILWIIFVGLLLVIAFLIWQNNNIKNSFGGMEHAALADSVDTLALTEEEVVVLPEEVVGDSAVVAVYDIPDNSDSVFSTCYIGDGAMMIPSLLQYKWVSDDGNQMYYDSANQIRLYLDYTQNHSLNQYINRINEEVGTGSTLISRDNCFVQTGYTRNNEIYYCKAYVDNSTTPSIMYTAIIYYPISRRNEVDGLLNKMFNSFPNIN